MTLGTERTETQRTAGLMMMTNDPRPILVVHWMTFWYVDSNPDRHGNLTPELKSPRKFE